VASLRLIAATRETRSASRGRNAIFGWKECNVGYDRLIGRRKGGTSKRELLWGHRFPMGS